MKKIRGFESSDLRRQRSLDDNNARADDNISLNSADFELAREAFHDQRVNSRYSNRSRPPTREQTVNLLEFDNASHSVSARQIIGSKSSTIRERTIKVKQKAMKELASIRNTVKSSFFEKTSQKNPDKAKEIYDHMEDLRQERQEQWCHQRGLQFNGMKNADKRELRAWFHELDHDDSGEVNADELQDPMISFGVLRTREQVVRLLNNIDRNKNTGIDFDEFLLALNSKDSANIQSLKKMQEAHSNVEGFAVSTLITSERRKNLFDNVVKASEKRNRELEFAVFRMGQHGARRTDDASSKTWALLEAKHHRNMRLHNKYIESLNNVLQTKVKQTNLEKERLEHDKVKDLQENASLTAEKIRGLKKRDDCSLIKESKLKRLFDYRSSREQCDEYGGKIFRHEPELPALSARSTYFEEAEEDQDFDPLRCMIYADKSSGPSTITQGKGGKLQRRPELCSSLPAAPPLVSLEKSQFSRNLRGPLTRAILEPSH